MPQYIVLANWTDQGIKNVKDSPKRAAAAKALVEKTGGKMTLYYTFGQYDMVAIWECPSDEVAMSNLLAIGSAGSIRTTTLKAFTDAEAAKIIEKLP